MADDQEQKVRGRWELCQVDGWMAGAAGSLCHAMLPRSGNAPWRRCSDGERAAGQGLQGLWPQRLEPSLVVRSQSLSECKLHAKRTGAGLDGRLSSLDPQPVGIMRPPFWSMPLLYTWFALAVYK